MSSIPLFSDRASAGIHLAERVISALNELRAAGMEIRPIVCALPRGGIPVALPMAQQLGCPVDIVVAKKITLAENTELAIGAATASGDVLWSNAPWIRNRPQLQEALQRAQAKAQNQLAQLQPCCPEIDYSGAIAILVDDGIATGMTMAVAVQALRSRQTAQIWICSPLAPQELLEWLGKQAERLIILDAPHPFFSVSRFYLEFPQLSLVDAQNLLRSHNQQFLA